MKIPPELRRGHMRAFKAKEDARIGRDASLTALQAIDQDSNGFNEAQELYIKASTRFDEANVLESQIRRAIASRIAMTKAEENALQHASN